MTKANISTSAAGALHVEIERKPAARKVLLNPRTKSIDVHPGQRGVSEQRGRGLGIADHDQHIVAEPAVDQIAMQHTAR
ncbi:hypothetical protein [Nocardia sp. NPDC051832]|uniref:hypothetical protein n=1 Tax=Nocardia sp. NPDC051832 TaxID=3155673 RepID=UPI00342825E0